MYIYKVVWRASGEEKPLHVRDKRPPKAIARDLVKEGYLVTEAVVVRAASSAFKDEDGHAVQEEFFSAAPVGAAVLVASAIAALVEHVVPAGAEPMPDFPA
ncbi:hypothetical protein [Xanthobacter aminoxidans]|uniref:Uncharacterized protein n=2 Tax=Xanthobacter aminoxidans TaxID=186280 RepID=A0ABW6ZI36_9HYPH